MNRVRSRHYIRGQLGEPHVTIVKKKKKKARVLLWAHMAPWQFSEKTILQREVEVKRQIVWPTSNWMYNNNNWMEKALGKLSRRTKNRDV